MGLASRGCLVLVLGAIAERRNLIFRSDLGLPWIRTLSLRPAHPGKAVKSVAPSVQRASRRPSPIPVRAHVRGGSTASTPISLDIDEQIEARLAPLPWTTIPDRVLNAEDLGAAPAPLVLARVQCYT